MRGYSECIMREYSECIIRRYSEYIRALAAPGDLRKGWCCAAHPGEYGYALSGMILGMECLYLKRKGMERSRMEMERKAKMKCWRMWAETAHQAQLPSRASSAPNSIYLCSYCNSQVQLSVSAHIAQSNWMKSVMAFSDHFTWNLPHAYQCHYGKSEVKPLLSSQLVPRFP